MAIDGVSSQRQMLKISRTNRIMSQQRGYDCDWLARGIYFSTRASQLTDLDAKRETNIHRLYIIILVKNISKPHLNTFKPVDYNYNLNTRFF